MMIIIIIIIIIDYLLLFIITLRTRKLSTLTRHRHYQWTNVDVL